MALASECDIRKDVFPQEAVVWNNRDLNATGNPCWDDILINENYHSIYWSKRSGIDRTESDENSKKFISFELSFNEQFKKLGIYYGGLDIEAARNKMRGSLAELLSFDPSAFSLELSHERNIFYTLIKDEITVFVTQSLEEDLEEDEDEIILSIFRGKEKLPSYSGSLSNTIDYLNGYINSPSCYFTDSDILSSCELSF